MKLSALVVCLGLVAASVASAASYPVTFFQKVDIAGTELKPGDYKLDLNGDTARFTYEKKMMVEAKVKVETDSAKNAKTTVRYGAVNGKNQVQEIRLGGTTTRLVFAE